MPRFVERFGLDGKKALVTGASKGMGVEICAVLADAGADIVAVARDKEGLAQTKALVEKAGRRCLTVEADMATVEGPRHAAKVALDAWGTIDILVNNAGIARVSPILEHSAEDWDLVMAVNLRAPFLMAQALAPKMIEQRRGKIINISSQTSAVALVDHAAYQASKNGLNALGKCMTIEWAQYNIQINAICPTVVMTPMGQQVWGAPEKGDPMKAKIPAGRFLESIEVADSVLFLASDASNMITGETLFLDGGYCSA
ncbi:SDR family NAD(P)-dependent oxidoreductase [Geminicoccus roseus]|uniref:SDR family NAD(P)-dependent oxidoreductase n=1 Tax=Geminicoccus roseus TaxID=404900 RepID=UPI0003F6579B|nr:glucose 1-dehydrogenase [Geminicoccus roseus]